MLKKNGQHESIGQLVANRDKGRDRPRRPDVKRDTCHELTRGPTERRSSNARQLWCVFQDMKPPKSLTLEELRHAETNPMRKIHEGYCTSHLNARPKSCARFFVQVNFISAVPTLQNLSNGLRWRQWQKQGAREAAWKLAKNVLKLKECERETFFSPSETRYLRALTLKLEEREFVVDSSSSMHMISKKDLSDDEMDTLTISCSPTIVTTANGEVQTHEEETVYVKELDIFLTMKVFETCQQYCCTESFAIWINGQEPHLLTTGFRYFATRRTSFLLRFQSWQ